MWDIMVDIIKGWCEEIIRRIESNLRNIANLIIVLLPYVMYFIGQHVCNERGKKIIGSEILIPFLIYIIVCFIKSYANKIGKGTTIPVPHKRFTEVDDNDEVSIENNRVQELILYTADLEDWLERKGLL